MITAVQSIGLLGENLIKHYGEDLKLTQLKIDTMQAVFAELDQGIPQEFEFKLSKLISYYVKDGKVNRILHNIIGDLSIPNSYFRWMEFPNIDISIIDVKKYPFTVTLRSKHSSMEIKQWSENSKNGGSL